MNDSERRTPLWWVIPGLLAGMPIPFVHPERRLAAGGPLEAFDDDLPLLWADGIRGVFSLLNIPSDTAVYTSAGFSYLCLPIPDGGAPSSSQSEEFVRFVNEQAAFQRPIAVHCEAGIGRTGTMLAVYLIPTGMSAYDAIAKVRSVEPAAVETAGQMRFLEEFAANPGQK
jgi:hypothetical protein